MIARGKRVAQKPDEADPSGRCKNGFDARQRQLGASCDRQHDAERDHEPEYDPRSHLKPIRLWNVRPRLSPAHARDRCCGYSIVLGDGGARLLSKTGPNNGNVFSRKLVSLFLATTEAIRRRARAVGLLTSFIRVWPIRLPKPRFDRVTNVLKWRRQFKVRHAVVGLDPVLMIDVKPISYFAFERLPNEPVGQLMRLAAGTANVMRRVACWRGGAKKVATNAAMRRNLVPGGVGHVGPNLFIFHAPTIAQTRNVMARSPQGLAA